MSHQLTEWASRAAALGRVRLTLEDGTWVVAEQVGGRVLDASPQLIDLVELHRTLWWPTVELGKPLEFIWYPRGMNPSRKAQTYTKAKLASRQPE